MTLFGLFVLVCCGLGALVELEELEHTVDLYRIHHPELFNPNAGIIRHEYV